MDSAEVSLSAQTADVTPVASFQNRTLDQARQDLAAILQRERVKLPLFG